MNKTTKTNETLVVIVPCLNEEANVEAAVESVLRVAEDLPVHVRVELVDDGSTDNTLEVIRRLEAEHDVVNVVANPRNLGLGRTVMNTLERLEPETWVTVFPGDNELAFDSIRAFVDVRHDYDIIFGYIQNPVIRTLGRRVASIAFTKTTKFIYGFGVTYLNGFKMYRAGAFQGLDVESAGHAYVAELLAKAILRDPELRIGEAPFVLKGRRAGSSKAIRPQAVLQAVGEVVKGKRSVDRFRHKMIAVQSDDD